MTNGGCCKRPGRRRQIGGKAKGEAKDAAKLASKAMNAVRRDAVARLRSSDTPQRECAHSAEEEETQQQRRKREHFSMPEDEQRRRLAIKEVFVNMGMPGREHWKGRNGTVSCIAKSLHLTEQSHRSIEDTLVRIVEDGENFDGKRRKGAGVQRLMSKFQCVMAGLLLVTGIGLTQTMYQVNDWRYKHGTDDEERSELCRETVRQGALSIGATERRRMKKKCGNTDPDSPWAKARLAQATQLLDQLELGRAIDSGLPVRRELLHMKAPPLWLDGILFVDEKHKKVRLGCASKWQWRVPVGRDGEYLAEDEGGELPPEMDVTTGKFEDEARGAFGVMIDAHGQGHRMRPFCYSGRKVVGKTTYEKKVADEIQRVNSLSGKTGVWAAYKSWDGLQGGRYEARYGSSWREEIDKHLKICSVCELVDHIIDEGDRLFKNTRHERNWVICYDALTQYWEAGAQDYLKMRGFGADRMVCAQGDTNAGTRYEGKLVGNSPELMPLDSNLFADLEHAIKLHVAMTAELPEKVTDGNGEQVWNPKKFNLGSPERVWDAMVRTWEVSPTPARIAQDVNRWESALRSVVQHRGGIVPDNNQRHGRRAVRYEPHPDCAEANAARLAKMEALAARMA